MDGQNESRTRVELNRLQQQVDNPGPNDDPAYAQILLNYQRELIELSIGMWDLYGKLIF